MEYFSEEERGWIGNLFMWIDNYYDNYCKYNKCIFWEVSDDEEQKVNASTHKHTEMETK